jgi:hypothetical protein
MTRPIILTLVLFGTLPACSSSTSVPTSTTDAPSDSPLMPRDAGTDVASDVAPSKPSSLCCDLNTGGSLTCDQFYCWNQDGNLTGAGACEDGGTCQPGWGCSSSPLIPGDAAVGIVLDCP